MSLFAYGSVKHLLALCNGTLPSVSQLEFNNRLQHLCHVFEILCLSSSLSDFDTQQWRVAREYDRKIISDIEFGLKQWESLKNCIDPTGWSYAKQMVTQNQEFANSKSPDRGQKICTTYNNFRKQGCHYEHSTGKSCIFLHQCSVCKGEHKFWECTVEDDQKFYNSHLNTETSE